MIIIIGGSGYIGEKLCEYFSKKNKLLAGTYCNSPKEGLQDFDLEIPNTIYGTHKKIIEDFLLNSGKPFLIARISKIFGLIPGDKTFLTSLVEQFKNNETVKCATDQIFSFTYVDDFVKALDLAIEKKLNGCYNIASPEIFSKFELTKLLKSKLEIKSGEIVSCSINDFKFLDSRPLDTSLKPDKIIKETGFEFSKMETCIGKLRG